jgi:hypothetical protein
MSLNAWKSKTGGATVDNPMHAFCSDDKIPWDKQECSPTATRFLVLVGCIVVATAVLAWWETRE